MTSIPKKPLELTVLFRDEDGDYRHPLGFWIPEADADHWAEAKRFTDAELAAEAHAFILTDHKYPADPDEYGDEEWEAYSREYQEAEKTIWRFATLPHYDEAAL